MLRNSEGTAAWAGYTLSLIQFVTKAIYEFIMHAGKIDVALVTVERLEECRCVHPNDVVARTNLRLYIVDSQLQPERGNDNIFALPEAWPEHGRLEVHNLTVRYDEDLPEVLHQVTFEVQPGEKVGIVGST